MERPKTIQEIECCLNKALAELDRFDSGQSVTDTGVVEIANSRITATSVVVVTILSASPPNTNTPLAGELIPGTGFRVRDPDGGNVNFSYIIRY
jgi:hypothetical protein